MVGASRWRLRTAFPHSRPELPTMAAPALAGPLGTSAKGAVRKRPTTRFNPEGRQITTLSERLITKRFRAVPDGT